MSAATKLQNNAEASINAASETVMSIEFAAIITIAAFTGIAMLGHVLVFRAMFAHADRVSARDNEMQADLSELTA